MARLSLPNDASLSAIQREIVEETLAGPRGAVPVPFAAWIHSPELARRAQSLGEFIRFQTSVQPRHARLAAMMTAHRYSTAYVWAGHCKGGLAAGLGEDVVQAIARSERPLFERDEDARVYDFIAQLLDAAKISDAAYAACEEIVGAPRLVELTAIVAYYTFVCMTLNAFEVGAPENPAASPPD